MHIQHPSSAGTDYVALSDEKRQRESFKTTKKSAYRLQHCLKELDLRHYKVNTLKDSVAVQANFPESGLAFL